MDCGLDKASGTSKSASQCTRTKTA